MRRRAADHLLMRRFLVPAAAGVALAVASAWAELVGFAWTDYETANVVPTQHLIHGELGAFLRTAPIEGPSLLLRAPFALASWLWGGSDLAAYRMLAVPGLLAGVVLGLVLLGLRERRLPGAGWGLAFVCLAAGNPVTLRALDIGHPEELLGAALCVGAVLAAMAQRPALAALLLGLALANKAWAIAAIGPVLVALESRRAAVLAGAGAIAAAFVAPFLLSGGREAVMSAGTTDTVFQPWQLWWPLGEHGHEIRGMFGALKVDYRAAPGWIAPITHPLIAATVVPASLAWWRRRPGDGRTPDVLLLLALLFLARCVLDPANNVYYHLPFLMALLAWEALARRRPPLLSLVAVCAIWATFQTLPPRISPDAQCAVYLAWALPALAALAWATFRLPSPLARGAALGEPAFARRS
jgi:hypothetical protein